MTALGFIETMGLLPAIEAADAMLKAADVRLVGKSLASGGLVTVSVAGEVAAVTAAVDAAAASLGRVHGARLVSRHVIARPDSELEKVFAVKQSADTGDAQAKAAAQPPAPDTGAPVHETAPTASLTTTTGQAPAGRLSSGKQRAKGAGGKNKSTDKKR